MYNLPKKSVFFVQNNDHQSGGSVNGNLETIKTIFKKRCIHTYATMKEGAINSGDNRHRE